MYVIDEKLHKLFLSKSSSDNNFCNRVAKYKEYSFDYRNGEVILVVTSDEEDRSAHLFYHSKTGVIKDIAYYDESDISNIETKSRRN